MKINKRVKITYRLKVKTGLHIGGSKGVYGIGGLDSPVIKNPVTNEPIIPGSSIKGKVRMLLEVVHPEDQNKFNKMFGYRQGEQNNPLSRVIFRDLELTKESKEELSKALDGEYTEIKAENTIDRARGTAKSPRFIERVPAGAVFEGEYIVQYLDTDQDNDFEELVKKGFKLLENNYLGGSGSRGYGKVEFEIINQEEL
ncbi:MAG: type III-A CRISPR-associated RAMP protein Csm3 [Acholeplasmataceae bacterium]|nr:type III-A CRISPR-associated RAMP protein Csm3 [Acholeplasmataceae bacterium]HQA19643.1 type III-A CRISPR-associated RAMP protein Csm3 [Bacilli bacterium]